MNARIARGEIALLALLTTTALVWIWGSLDLPFWSGFAPDSGFLPLIYGVLLLGLCLAIAASIWFAPAPEDTEREPVGKSLQIIAALTVSVVAIGFVGFIVATFGLMAFLYAYVERLPILRSVLAAAGVTAVLILIFVHWLAIPLPLGPMGF